MSKHWIPSAVWSNCQNNFQRARNESILSLLVYSSVWPWIVYPAISTNRTLVNVQNQSFWQKFLWKFNWKQNSCFMNNLSWIWKRSRAYLLVREFGIFYHYFSNYVLWINFRVFFFYQPLKIFYKSREWVSV